MRFDDEIQFAQEIFHFLGTFDFDGSRWVAQLDLHERMIRPMLEGLQECIQVSAAPDHEWFASEMPTATADDVRSLLHAEISPILLARPD